MGTDSEISYLYQMTTQQFVKTVLTKYYFNIGSSQMLGRLELGVYTPRLECAQDPVLSEGSDFKTVFLTAI